MPSCSRFIPNITLPNPIPSNTQIMGGILPGYAGYLTGKYLGNILNQEVTGAALGSLIGFGLGAIGTSYLKTKVVNYVQGHAPIVYRVCSLMGQFPSECIKRKGIIALSCLNGAGAGVLLYSTSLVMANAFSGLIFDTSLNLPIGKTFTSIILEVGIPSIIGAGILSIINGIKLPNDHYYHNHRSQLIDIKKINSIAYKHLTIAVKKILSPLSIPLKYVRTAFTPLSMVSDVIKPEGSIATPFVFCGITALAYERYLRSFLETLFCKEDPLNPCIRGAQDDLLHLALVTVAAMGTNHYQRISYSHDEARKTFTDKFKENLPYSLFYSLTSYVLNKYDPSVPHYTVSLPEKLQNPELLMFSIGSYAAIVHCLEHFNLGTNAILPIWLFSKLWNTHLAYWTSGKIIGGMALAIALYPLREKLMHFGKLALCTLGILPDNFPDPSHKKDQEGAAFLEKLNEFVKSEIAEFQSLKLNIESFKKINRKAIIPAIKTFAGLSLLSLADHKQEIHSYQLSQSLKYITIATMIGITTSLTAPLIPQIFNNLTKLNGARRI